ncbi:MAG: hypothetical protein K2Y21_12220 [Phycisphaerales bacterium]|nr:hypothetical protein [Phycisphaerales bacterium]
MADGNVDRSGDYRRCGSDLYLLAAGNGASIGSTGYVPEADLDVDGEVGASDYAVLRFIGCPADLNCNDIVDDADFEIFAAAYEDVISIGGDFDGDGLTVDADFEYFAASYSTLVCAENAPPF